jgi:hypothetical protein
MAGVRHSTVTFTTYSVDVEKFLPHTQKTGNNVYRIVSRLEIIFTAYLLRQTLHKWIFWFGSVLHGTP